MPKYLVETDRGNFEVELDKPPASPEELRSLVTEAMAGQGGAKEEHGILQAARAAMDVGVGVGEGFYRFGAGIAGLPGAIYQAAKQTPSDIAEMARRPEIIPGVLGQTVKNTLEMAPAAAGGIAGGAPGAMLAQGAYDWLKGALQGQFLPLQESTARMAEMAAPSAIGRAPKLLAPRAGRVTPQGAELARTAERAGFTPSPADVAPGKLIRPLEAIAEKQLGGGRITAAGEAEVTAMRGQPSLGKPGYLENRLQGLTKDMGGLTPAERGRVIQGGLEDIAKTHRIMGSVEWDALKTFDTGVPDFPLGNLREAMRQKMATAGHLQQAIDPRTSAKLTSTGGKMRTSRPGTASEIVERPVRLETGELLPTSIEGGPFKHGAVVTPDRPIPGSKTFTTERMVHQASESSIIQGLARGEGPVTFEQARALRTALGELYEGDPKRWGGPLSALREDMSAYAAKNPQRMVAYDAARKYTREKVVPFNRDQPLGRLIDANEPVSVVKSLLAPKDGRIESLKAIAEQTQKQGSAWAAIKAEALSQAVADPRMIRTMGPETKRILFDKPAADFLSEYTNWLQTSTAPLKESRGIYRPTGVKTAPAEQLQKGLVLILAGGASAGSHYLGVLGPMGAVASGAAVLFTPNVIARMLTNPTSAKWLSEGFKVTPGTQQALTVSSNLLRAYLSLPREGGRQ